MQKRNSNSATDETPPGCYHCGEPVAAGAPWALVVDGERRALCCAGCEGAARAILDFGLGDYYRFRERPAQRPAEAVAGGTPEDVYDDPALSARYVTREGDEARAALVVGGMTCSACAWLLERRLAAEPGVRGFEINYATRRAEARWDATRLGLGALCRAAGDLGLELRPFTADARRALDAAEARGLLARLGTAGVFGMQVMMIALALYFGAGEAGDGALGGFLRWASLLLTLPVVSYSAAPFFRAAWRGLRTRAPGMDLPVSLAIGAAFAGSAWHTVVGVGEVYFDSVVMFTGFLLLSRWLELRARVAAATRLESLAAVVPDAATRIVGRGDGERLETVAAVRLAVGDRVLVRGGETVPADGVIEDGDGSLDESILTGEAEPQARGPGARVLAGSVNLASPLRVQVSGVGAQSFAGHLAALVHHAADARPAHDDLAARVARGFVVAVLATAALTALLWAWLDPARAFAATLAVLVVSCPCALAIARPAALAAAHAALLGAGVAVIGAGALERLAGVVRVVFDKTGTLTAGRLGLVRTEAFGAASAGEVEALAAALAEGSTHPLARALRVHQGRRPLRRVEGLEAVAGSGALGRIDDVAVVFGSRRFVAERCGAAVFAGVGAGLDGGGKEAWLARDGEVIGRLEFADDLRPEAPRVVADLHAAGLACEVLSGDREVVVAAVANACGIAQWQAGQRPADKLAAVARHQAAGEVVAMVGDGVNDSAVMARADVSIAVADASAPARQQADILLLRPDLGGVVAAVRVARRMARVVRQNLAWALAYNALAVPLAIAAWLPPWAAALGMSSSSLLVVLNALRIRAPAG
ncbi:MAG: heavy metal translocating P-type ATPase [Gammaproteobacteria bacterium]|nr:heavy metal translocating P-type ATPase [Gammaproteobacteria bacterium]